MVWLPVAWLVALFALGGSARGDVPFLVGLRLASLIAVGVGIWLLDAPQWRRLRTPLLLLLAYLGLTALHLVPLPPALWLALPHDPLVQEIARVTQLTSYWRPLTISSPDTMNAALAAFPVMAVMLLLGAAGKARWHVLIAVIAIALASILLGLLQMNASASSKLYIYRYFNAGYPIGFFANRNHQAVFLAACLPMLSALALYRDGRFEARVRKTIAAGAAAIVLATIVVLGSRAGVAMAALGLAWAAGMMLRLGGIPARFRTRKATAIGALLAIATLAVLAAGVRFSETGDRIRAADMSSELRVQIVAPILRLSSEYFPFGSGIGTFVQAYRAREPDSVIRMGYVNHAHNDWLEWLLTGGLPLLMIVAVVTFLVLRQFPRVWRAKSPSEDVLLAHAGLSFCVILAIASLFDYPLRTPALAGLFAISAVWLNDFARRSAKSGETHPSNRGTADNV